MTAAELSQCNEDCDIDALTSAATDLSGNLQ
jgi:hypothetical protein